MDSGYSHEQASAYSESVNYFRSQDSGTIQLRKLVLEEFEKISENSKPPPEKILVADIGCGNGDDLNYLSTQGISTSNLVGIEPSSSYSQPDNLTILNGRVESLPLSDSSVEIAFSRHALHYCSNLNEAFQEVSRALKSNASLYAIVSHPAADALCKKTDDGRIIVDLFNGAVHVTIHPYQIQDYKNAACKNGMSLDILSEYWAPGRDETPNSGTHNAMLLKFSKQ